MRPDVAAAFDRDVGGRRPARGSPSSSTRASAPTPSRRRCSPPTRIRVGRAAGPLAASLRHRARPRPARRLRLAGGQRAPLRLLQRYSWEPWHFGFDAGPPPCSAAGNAVTGSGRRRRRGRGSGGLPSFVPARFRAPLLRVGGALGRLRRPARRPADGGVELQPVCASSPAGAQGIAQFIPSTARGLRPADPFDPEAAIDAQAHLMSDLLRQFGSPALALAAYNAGPGAGRRLRLRARDPRDDRPTCPASSACSSGAGALLGAAVRGAADRVGRCATACGRVRAMAIGRGRRESRA